MEILKVKAWKERGKAQFEIILPGSYDMVARRLKDSVLFTQGDCIFFKNGKGIMQSAGIVSFSVDNIHLAVRFDEITATLEINNVWSINDFVRDIANGVFTRSNDKEQWKLQK